MNKILLAMVLVALGIVAFGSTMHGGTASAQVFPTPTIIPSGCFADATGNVVCGPNWSPPPGPVQPASCNATPLTCATVLQASAFGVRGDNSTDNAIAMTSAITAACALASGTAGVTIQLPTGTVKWTPGVVVPCSNITIAGYGMGSTLASPAYPTPVAAATVISAFAASATPLLSFQPAGTVIQANNILTQVEVDDGGGLASTGIYITGETGMQILNVSCNHFSYACIDRVGKALQISPYIHGGVRSPVINNLFCNESLSTDGACVRNEGVYSQAATNGDDTFDAWDTNVACVHWTYPCWIYNRSDNNYLSNIHVVTAAGAPTPAPAPSINDILMACGSQSNTITGYLGKNTVYQSGSTTCPSPTNDPGTNVAAQTTLIGYRIFDGNNSGPTLETGAGPLSWTNEANDIYYPVNSGVPGHIAWGNIAATGNSPATGVPYLSSDGTNLYMGARGTAQCMQIRFIPLGSGNAALGTDWTGYSSYINCVHGGLDFNGSNTDYGRDGATIVGPVTLGQTTGGNSIPSLATTGTAYLFNNSGATSGTLVNFQSNGTSEFSVAPSGNAIFAGSTPLTFSNLSGNTIASASTSGAAFILNNTGSTSGNLLNVQTNGVNEFTLSTAGVATFTKQISANGGSQVSPIDNNAGTCSLAGTSSCTATTVVLNASVCVSGFTSDPNIDAVHTLSIWNTRSGTTLTTHVEVAQGTTTTNTPTWNVVCL